MSESFAELAAYFISTTLQTEVDAFTQRVGPNPLSDHAQAQADAMRHIGTGGHSGVHDLMRIKMTKHAMDDFWADWEIPTP